MLVSSDYAVQPLDHAMACGLLLSSSGRVYLCICRRPVMVIIITVDR
jgi:hypothetical protein